MSCLVETLIDRKRELEIQKTDNEKSEIQEANTNEENKTSIHFGSLGNGITVYDISRTDNRTNDYPTVAHISEEGSISYYDDNLKAEDIELIEKEAARQRAEFTESWNKLSIIDKYAEILDKANITQQVDITKEKLSVEESVKKYEHSIIFKDEPFPDKNNIAENAVDTDNSKTYTKVEENINNKEQVENEKPDIVKALENGQTIYFDDTPVPMIADGNKNYFSNQKLLMKNDGTFKLSGKVARGLGIPQDFEIFFESAEKAEKYIKSGNMKYYIENVEQSIEDEKEYRYEVTQTSDAYDVGENFAAWDNKKNDYHFDKNGTIKTFETEEEAEEYLKTLKNYVLSNKKTSVEKIILKKKLQNRI